MGELTSSTTNLSQPKTPEDGSAASLAPEGLGLSSLEQGRPHNSPWLPERESEQSGGWSLLPGNKKQDKRKWPQVGQGK